MLHYLFIEGFRLKKGGRKIKRFKGIKQTQGKRDQQSRTRSVVVTQFRPFRPQKGQTRTKSSLVPHRKGQTKLLYLSKTHRGGINTRDKYKSLLSPNTLRIRTLPTKDKDLDLHSDKELSNLDRRGSQLSLSTRTVPNTTPRIFNFLTHARPSGCSVRSF